MLLLPNIGYSKSRRWGDDHSGSEVLSNNYFQSLKHWGRGFESNSRHECRCVFIPVLLSCVGSSGIVAGGGGGGSWSQSKESYRLCTESRNLENGHGPTKGCIIIIIPPLWYSGQRSWLQFQRSEFDSGRYQIFWEVVGLERGPLSLVCTFE
jgi:hypothetical protein